MNEGIRQCDDRQASVSVATRMLAWPFGIVWLMLVMYCIFATHVKLALRLNGIGYLLWCGIVIAPIIVFGGELIGWLAWRIVGQTTVPASRMALAISATLDFALVGWILVVLLQ